MHELERQFFVDKGIVGLVHDTHSPFADLGVDEVTVRDARARLKIYGIGADGGVGSDGHLNAPAARETRTFAALDSGRHHDSKPALQTSDLDHYGR